MSKQLVPRVQPEAPNTSEDRPPTPPWRRTLGALLIAQFVSIFGFSLVQPFLPFYVKELGVRGDAQVAAWAGLIVGSMSITFGIFAPFWGAVADKYGRKMMVGRAMFGAVLTLVLMGLCRNVYQLLAVRLLQGTLTGTVTATNTLVSSVVPRRRMGLSLGLNQTMVVLGLAAGPWVGGYLAEYWGLRTSCFVAAGILFAAGLVAMFGAHEDFEKADGNATGNGHGLRQAFGRRGLVAVLVGLFIVALSLSFSGPIFPLLVEGIVGSAKAASVTGMLLGAGGLAAGLAATAVGRLGDRKGHKNLLVGVTLVSGLLVMPQAFVQTVAQLLPIRMLVSGATGGIQPSMNAFISTAVSPDMLGRAYGVTRSANAMGMAAGPILCGLAASVLGFRMPFLIMGVLFIISSGVLSRFVKPANSVPADQDVDAPGEDGSGQATR